MIEKRQLFSLTYFIQILLLVIISIRGFDISACSIFYISSGDNYILGRNLDWEKGIPGLVCFNDRGVSKIGFTWQAAIDSQLDSQAVRWRSKYGSVTFSAFGLEFPDGGMNEMGLVVEETSLPQTRRPEPDNRKKLTSQQWIQYQLDNYATVTEVIDHLKDFNQTGWGLHFMVADSKGDCAVVEYIDKDIVVHRNDKLPVKVLTTNIYDNALKYLKRHEGFGGTMNIPDDNSSLSRFVRAAETIRSNNLENKNPSVDFGFSLLNKIADSIDTKRSIIYDIGSGIIYYRTGLNNKARRISLEDIDFSCDGKTGIIDIEADFSTDVSRMASEKTEEINESLITDVLSVLLEDYIQPELDAHDLTLEQYIKALARVASWNQCQLNSGDGSSGVMNPEINLPGE